MSGLSRQSFSSPHRMQQNTDGRLKVVSQLAVRSFSPRKLLSKIEGAYSLCSTMAALSAQSGGLELAASCAWVRHDRWGQNMLTLVPPVMSVHFAQHVVFFFFSFESLPTSREEANSLAEASEAAVRTSRLINKLYRKTTPKQELQQFINRRRRRKHHRLCLCEPIGGRGRRRC